MRDLLARYHDPYLQRSTIKSQKSVCQNLFMGQSYGPCRIFLPAFLLLDLSKYGHILGKTLCSGPTRRPGQASPWGHKPSSSAPCAVPMRLSRIDQHIKDEPCARQRALLGVSSSRSSSVSRGVRSVVPIFTFLPLLLLYVLCTKFRCSRTESAVDRAVRRMLKSARSCTNLLVMNQKYLYRQK